jgi:hypothetical protein
MAASDENVAVVVCPKTKAANMIEAAENRNLN